MYSRRQFHKQRQKIRRRARLRATNGLSALEITHLATLEQDRLFSGKRPYRSPRLPDVDA